MHRIVLNRLTDTHRNVERVLSLFRIQLDVFHSKTDADGLKLLQNALGYVRNFPALIHHPTEEIIFSRLASHAPATRSLCNNLTAQHVDFKQQESALLLHIAEMQRGEALAVQQVKKIGTEYCREHAIHIEREEREAFPQAIKWLSPSDWSAVDKQHKLMTDPLSDLGMLRRYDNLYDCLMASGEHFILH